MNKLALLTTGFFLAGAVYAGPISAVNVRPETIDAPTSGEDSVQTILDNGFGVGLYDDTDDQKGAGYFKIAKAISNGILPQLVLRNDTDLTFGIFTLPELDDSNTMVTAELFPSTASDGDMIMVKWTDDDTVEIGGTTTDGIRRDGFGFYAEDAAGARYYTLDGLNGGAAQTLAINNGKDNEWTFFFETNSDQENDFNEAVLFVESITPVPEPGTFVLFGAGAIAAFVIRRRRQS